MLIDIYGHLTVPEAKDEVIADIEFWIEVRREYVMLLGPEACETMLEEKRDYIVKAIRTALSEFLDEKWKIIDFYPRRRLIKRP